MPAKPAVPLTMKNPVPDARKWNEKLNSDLSSAEKTARRCQAMGMAEAGGKLTVLKEEATKFYDQINEMIVNNKQDVEDIGANTSTMIPEGFQG